MERRQLCWQRGTWKNAKDAVGNFLRKAKKELGITGRINAHAFRHGADGDLGYSQTEHVKKLLLGHAGNIKDHYTQNDALKLREAVETEWEAPAAYPPATLPIRFTPGIIKSICNDATYLPALENNSEALCSRLPTWDMKVARRKLSWLSGVFLGLP